MTIQLHQGALDRVNKTVRTPGYAREELTPGILHIGVGNFHRAHQTVYLDELFEMGSSLDWGIVGAGVRAADETMRANLAQQDWMSSVTEVEHEQCETRVCGSMIDFVEVNPKRLIDALANPQIRIISLTITEGGYFLDQEHGGFNRNHPDILRDVAQPDDPKTVFGILIAAFDRRRRAGLAPITLLSCDNIPSNGDAARDAIDALAPPPLPKWIDANVFFPNSMVDCITPATGAREHALARAQLGVEDRAPVVCESFRQWVIEDRFACDRPALERVGVEFVENVTAHELMKLRILNGGHACIAYPSALLGVGHAHEAMEHSLIRGFLQKVEAEEIIPSVRPIDGVDATGYFETIKRRFANSGIADSIGRLCMDGSNRQPKFILPTIRERMQERLSVDGLALEVALWCRYCVGEDEAGGQIKIDDIHARRLRESALRAQREPMEFLMMNDLFGDLASSKEFAGLFSAALNSLQRDGVAATLQQYIGGQSA
ncbi:MAG: mannitol dehydrogenase family protein [bacterium]